MCDVTRTWHGFATTVYIRIRIANIGWHKQQALQSSNRFSILLSLRYDGAYYFFFYSTAFGMFFHFSGSRRLGIFKRIDALPFHFTIASGIHWTCICSAAPCELLVLFEDDFISILKPYMGKIWNEKKRAIKALDYFDFLDESQVI